MSPRAKETFWGGNFFSPSLSIPQPVVYGYHQDSSADSSRTGSEHSKTGKAAEAPPVLRFCALLLVCCILRSVLTHICAAGSLFGQMATALVLSSVSAQIYSLPWILFLTFKLQLISFLLVLPMVHLTVFYLLPVTRSVSYTSCWVLKSRDRVLFIFKWNIK